MVLHKLGKCDRRLYLTLVFVAPSLYFLFDYPPPL